MKDDYYGPLWDADPESRMGYLSIDNTRLSSYTETAQTERGGPTVNLAFAENGDLLGVEVLW